MNPTTHTTVTAFAAAALLLAGCSATTSGTPTADTDTTGFDPCSVLSVDDVADTYVKSALPLALTRRIEPGGFAVPGFASCQYGTWENIGVVVQFPLGDLPTDVGDLIAADYTPGTVDVTLPNGDSGSYNSAATKLAVQHGDVQFIVKWTSLDPFDGGTISQTTMSELAALVANRLPASFTLTDYRPEECAALPGAAEIVGGIKLAWGSADVDHLYCDYIGPDGILTATATQQEPEWVEDRIVGSRLSDRRGEVAPAIAEDAVVVANGQTDDGWSQRDGLYIQGYLRLCCELSIEFHTLDDLPDEKRSREFDSTERDFVTGFVGAARGWVTR